MTKTSLIRLSPMLCRVVLTFSICGSLFAADGPPDLTQNPKVDRELTYNLGATGLRGWIYSKPATHFDGLQGRTTAASRQILVTHVGVKSPADGVLQVDDVILGAGGKAFADDARKSFAVAIQEAEKESNGGLLKLTRWRAGQTAEVQLQLRVMGTYAETAPYDCPKSRKIFDEACEVLEREPLPANWHGAINGLALLATGKLEYLPRLKTLARELGTSRRKTERHGMGTWESSYRNLFLCEYFLATGDSNALPAIREITVALAQGQSMYGTFGHGFAERTPEGRLHGSIPPYGPVNQAGLPANLAILLGEKCGVEDPEIHPALERAASFFGYFVDKGTIPYGEHEPWPFHDNNGKSAMSAVLFGLQNKASESQFFAKMTVASYRNRECGHTGQGFSYLWGALGANVGGPEAAAAFFKEASWHFDLVRRSDGSFTYDGGEQYGPGQTDDNTYYGKSDYYGLSPAASYVLTYSLPLKKILLTGRESKPTQWLSRQAVAAAVKSGRFDTESKTKSPRELVAAFRDWSPIVRSWAAEELAKRPAVDALVPELIQLANAGDVHQRQGACETLGLLRRTEALSVLIALLSHEDRWLRFKAAQALQKFGLAAKPAIPEILKAVAKTAEPIQPINWADPVQLTHGQLATCLFTGPMADAVKGADRKLLYPAIRAISTNADGMARATLRGFFEKQLALEDVQALAPEIYAAVKFRSPADTMFGNEIRMGGFKALTKYHFKEGIELGILFARTQGGHGSESRTGEIMKEIAKYGSAAKSAVPDLRALIEELHAQCARGEFPTGELNNRRVSAVEEAIKSIDAAASQPELRSIPSHSTNDWPQFRGPNSDGHAPPGEFPIEWSETKNVAWKVRIPGLGWSSPAIANGKVFVTTSTPRGEGLSLRAIALDADTGKMLWDREVRAVEKAPSIHAKNSHASPTPLVRDGAVFVHFGALGMARLAATDGTVQWICTELEYPPLHGSGGSPVMHDGKLVVVCDGSTNPFVAAVEAETGKVAWKTFRSVQARISHSFVTPIVAMIEGKAQVLAPGPDHFAAYDLANGAELWQVKAPGWSVAPQPTLGHGLVIYNRDYDNPELLAVKLGGKGDVTDSHIVWRIKRGAPSTPTPLLVGDELYFVSDNGIASCVNAKTGAPYWTERLGGNFSASPVFANGRVLFLNEDGLATWVKAGKEFANLGANQVPGRTFATPGFYDGAMYLRTDEHLYKIKP